MYNITMSLRICSLASGSSGNSIYIASDTTKILVDIGVSVKRIETSLNMLKTNGKVDGVLVTHAHSDHISGLPTYINKFDAEVYCHYQARDTISRKGVNEKRIIEFGEGDFFVGDITVSPFKVSHDVPCVGFSFYNKGKKISIATDLGFIGNGIIKNLEDSDLVLLEANHDENLVKINTNYSSWLKSRILSEKGHLSNFACGEAVVKLARAGVKDIILGHLSKENNYPELAFNTVSKMLEENDYIEGEHIKLEVARFDRMSSLYEII